MPLFHSQATSIDGRANLSLGDIQPPVIITNPLCFAVFSFFKFLLAHAAENGLTAERILSMQRSCFLPDSRRPSLLLQGKGLRRWEQQHSRGKHDRGSDTEELKAHSGASSSVRLNQQSSIEGAEGRAVGTAPAGAGEGVTSESKQDAIGLVLHYILTGN